MPELVYRNDDHIGHEQAEGEHAHDIEHIADVEFRRKTRNDGKYQQMRDIHWIAQITQKPIELVMTRAIEQRSNRNGHCDQYERATETYQFEVAGVSRNKH